MRIYNRKYQRSWFKFLQVALWFNGSTKSGIRFHRISWQFFRFSYLSEMLNQIFNKLWLRCEINNKLLNWIVVLTKVYLVKTGTPFSCFNAFFTELKTKHLILTSYCITWMKKNEKFLILEFKRNWTFIIAVLILFVVSYEMRILY